MVGPLNPMPPSGLPRPKSDPRFGQAALNYLDIVNPGSPPIAQNKFIYGTNIMFRVQAARGPNEVMEILRRDILGWLFWFYTTPLIQRAVVALAPAKVRKALLTQAPKPKSGILSQFNWRLNPIARWSLTSSNQINEYLSKVRYAKHSGFLSQLRMWRAAASAVGLVTAIVALGIGINLINIAITRKNVMERSQHTHH